jgi:ATP phosphoribosyltransferase
MGEPLTLALTLAIPSKGRLKEQLNAKLAEAGIVLTQVSGARGYRAVVEGIAGIDVMLLASSEIAAALAEGDVHLGVTGEDLIREAVPDLKGRIELLKPLGFGFADVVVAVPRSWIDVFTMADLDDICAAYAVRHRKRLRIATKYTQITRRFFARAGISDYRIVASAGATEGAPTAGTAEAIVDITTSGATLAANGLKILDDGVILKSQAQLAKSLKADWTDEMTKTANTLLKKLGVKPS